MHATQRPRRGLATLPTFATRAILASPLLALVFCSSGCSSERPERSASAGEASLEQRLQKVEDEKQIRDLMIEYGQALDTLDFEAYSQLFAREGEWSGQLSEYTTVRGPAAIRSAMEEAFASRTYMADRVTNVHLISNIKIDVEEDRATGYSKWTVLSRDDSDHANVRVSGQYDDVYIREDGRWKFLSRVAHREMP